MLAEAVSLIVVVACLVVPALRELLRARHEMYWEYGIPSVTLFWTGFLGTPVLWMLFPFWGFIFELGQVPMVILFTIFAVACATIVAAGTWNGKRCWVSAACITYGTALGVVIPWVVWASQNVERESFFTNLYALVFLSLGSLTAVAATTVRFRIGRDARPVSVG